MNDNEMIVDYERNKVTVPVFGNPRIVILDKGRARLIELPAHGEFLVKTHDGKISHYEGTEKYKF